MRSRDVRNPHSIERILADSDDSCLYRHRDRRHQGEKRRVCYLLAGKDSAQKVERDIAELFVKTHLEDMCYL